MPRWSEVSVNLAEVKKDAQVVGGGARCRPRWRWSLGQYQSGARCRTQVVEGGGGAAHHLHLVSHKNLGQYQSGARCRPRWLKVEVEPPTISTW